MFCADVVVAAVDVVVAAAAGVVDVALDLPDCDYCYVAAVAVAVALFGVAAFGAV